MNGYASPQQSFLWALLGAAVTLLSCDASLKSVSLIEETRVLGARVEVDSDPTRSSPRPGERATLRLFVVAADEPATVSYAISVCAVRPVNSGFPDCTGSPLANSVQTEPSASAPTITFDVPAELDLAATPHGFAKALVCPNGSLTVAESGFPGCTDGAGTEVNFEFDLGGPNLENHSPSITEGSLTLDGQLWLATDAAVTCTELPAVSAGSKHSLAITLRDTDFEPLPRATSLEPGTETLLVSQFSNAGKLNHAFVSVAADTPLVAREVTWDAPDTSWEEARPIRFHFVVRDARGGEDFATRTLCVGP